MKERLGRSLYWAFCVWAAVDWAIQYPRLLAVYAGIAIGALVWDDLGRPA